ncbi:MAG: PEP-CTERM sorting domain-containing protein [Rhodothalassiaceae bacterium]
MNFSVSVSTSINSIGFSLDQEFHETETGLAFIESATISLETGGIQTVTYPVDAEFIGLISDSPFTGVLYTLNVENAAPPRFGEIFGAAAADIPQPGSLAMAGLGLIGLGFARRGRLDEKVG